MRNYIAMVRDHSGSMATLAHGALRDYNATVETVRDGSIANNQETLVSVVELGYGRTNLVRLVYRNVAAQYLPQLTSYEALGAGTPLWDAVGLAINELQNLDTRTDPDVSYVVMVTTDGQENCSRSWNVVYLAERIRQLQSTDRWTFVFRVPRGYSSALTRMGIPAANILEWEQSIRGLEVAQATTQTSFDNYFTARSAGQTSTPKFFVDLSNVSSATVELKLVDISSKVSLWPVSKAEDKSEIRPFVEQRLGKPLKKGAAFYQLTRSEEVQEYKIILIRDKTTNAIYGGSMAKQMLGVPVTGLYRLAPSKLGNYDVYIQSTSINRKLVAGTHVLHWEEAGK